MLRLRRLKINKFRAVKPGTELFFNDGFNLVLGRNATGKTTLLDLISMALRFDFSSIRDEDFDVEVEVDELLEGTSNSVVMQVGTRVDDSEMAMRMPGQQQRIPWVKATIRVGPHTYSYDEDGLNGRLLQNETLVKSERLRGEWGRILLWQACFLIHEQESSLMPLPIWESVEFVLRHDESLEAFKEDILSKLELNVTFVQAGEKITLTDNGPLWHDDLFAPEGLLDEVNARFADTPNAAVLTFSGDDLPFLDEFIQLCAFVSARLELSLLGKHAIQGSNNSWLATFGEPRFLFTRKDGKSTIRHELLSYGQKRLLSLLYFLKASPHHLVADEMVNGLHHEWIEVLMEKIRGRQTFLSSQNPLLLDYMEFDSAEEVSRSFVLCEPRRSRPSGLAQHVGRGGQLVLFGVRGRHPARR